MRIGIIGTDTSHVVAFTRVLNDPANPDHIPGFRVVAAVKGGSMDIPSSRSRIEEYAAELHDKWKVELVSEVAGLAGKVDAILLEDVDGRAHLQHARDAVKLHKPMFIDKPLASTLEDAREIAKLAAAEKVLWFSASSLRFGELVASAKIPDTVGVTVWGPGPVEEHHALDLSWYGIHPVEMLYTLMGTGCETVTRTSGGTNAAGTDVITCRWKDGRVGSVRVLRPNGGYGAISFGPKEVRSGRTDVPPFSYVLLLKQITKFFETGVSPVSNAETLETIAFMDAAQRSKQAGGQPVTLATSDAGSEVSAALNSWKQAALKGDAVTLGRLYHDDLAYTHSNGMTQNKAVVIAAQTNPTGIYKGIEMRDLDIHVYGNTAVLKYKLDLTHFAGDTAHLHEVMVWLKSPQGWQMLTRHATRLPQQ